MIWKERQHRNFGHRRILFRGMNRRTQQSLDRRGLRSLRREILLRFRLGYLSGLLNVFGRPLGYVGIIDFGAEQKALRVLDFAVVRNVPVGENLLRDPSKDRGRDLPAFMRANRGIQDYKHGQRGIVFSQSRCVAESTAVNPCRGSSPPQLAAESGSRTMKNSSMDSNVHLI
jgi:hypothetical protein